MVSARVNQTGGLALVRSALEARHVDWLTTRIGGLYQALDTARRDGDFKKVGQLVRPPEKFVPTASSFTALAALALNELTAVLQGLSGEVQQWLLQALCAQPACNLDQAWVRRQYAPKHYPRLHAAHGWHQDGALGFEFAAQEPAANSILPMVTCWIALTACGVNAPGLEFVRERMDNLLKPSELNDPVVRDCFTKEVFWRPALQPGDALLFQGDILHRTYVTPEMTADRTSIELRFFPANQLPERLRTDRFLPF